MWRSQCELAEQSQILYEPSACYITMGQETALKAQSPKLRILQYGTDVCMLAAVALGLWDSTQNAVIAFSYITALIGICCALRYYSKVNTAVGMLYHTLAGCLVGIVACSDSSDVQQQATQTAMKILFVTSLVLAVLCHVLKRIIKETDSNPGILRMAAAFQGLGLVTGGWMTGTSAWALGLMTLAFLMHIAALRLRSIPASISLAAFVSSSLEFIFPSLSLSPNPYALACIAGRHALPAVLDLYLTWNSTLDRWRDAVFTLRPYLRYLCVVLKAVLDVVLFAEILNPESSSLNYIPWYTVLLSVAGVLVWTLLQVPQLAAYWKFMKKLTQCNLDFINMGQPAHSYPRIMAARGMRHFGLMVRRVIFINIIFTLVLLGLSWWIQNPYSLTLVFAILPLQAATLSLFGELGDRLGGTCTAYGIIAPVRALSSRPGDGETLMSTAEVREMTKRRAGIEDQVQEFFTFHMMKNYGVDLATSGLIKEFVYSKLNAFFQQCTDGGPRFDTYLLYFCGDVLENGDWVLRDETSDVRLTLDTLLKWWKDKNGTSGARLILILDSTHSYMWAQKAKRIPEDFVFVQTCQYTTLQSADLEAMEALLGCVGVGSFTKAYVQHNTGQELTVDWSDKYNPFRAIYTVSQRWTDFEFHMPTREDYETFWMDNFPSFTRPLLCLFNDPGVEDPFYSCTSVSRFLRKLWMSYFPPQELDTGHGFKLINS